MSTDDNVTIARPAADLLERLMEVSAASLAASLNELGLVVDPFIQGPTCWTPGVRIVGPALTLQFLPKRADVYPEGEYREIEAQLHRHVLHGVQAGDVVVVDARANMRSGVFGDMMLTYFKGKGGAGLVVDGCIRDYAKVRDLGLGLWLRGVTPNYHTQAGLYPAAINVPIACGGVLVRPGDIIVADEDGAVAVPQVYAEQALESAAAHEDWEPFSKQRLREGGDLRRYYPLHPDARSEFEAWKTNH